MRFVLLTLAAVLALPTLVLAGIALGPAALVILFVIGIALATMWLRPRQHRHA